MVNKKKEIIFMEIIGVLIMLGSYLIQVFLKVNFRVGMVALAIYLIVFMIKIQNYKIDNMSESFYKNRMSLMYIEFAKIILLMGINIECHFKGVTQNSFTVMTFICMVVFVLDMQLFLKKANAENFINYIQGTYLIVYLYAMGTVRSYWIIFSAIPIFTVTALYNKSKWLKVNYIFVQIMTFLISARHIIYVYNNDKYYIGIYVVTNLFIAAFCVTVMRTTKINEMTSQDKLLAVNEKKEMTLKFANEVIAMGKTIRDNSHLINNTVSNIDVSTNNAIIIFEDIKAGNEKNIQSVDKQLEMTNKIIKLTEDVNHGMKRAMQSMREAYAGLEKSIASMKDLKNKSEIIVKCNQDVIKVINKFKENISKMSNTVSEIASISEQTNLLSLNASIESARAGEKGKGFAVVASEITSLSEETEDLTRYVSNMMSKLEESVNMADVLLKNVTSLVENEDVTIDISLDNVNEIRKGIMGLEGTIRNVLKEAGSIVDISGLIEQYSLDMDDLSKRITSEISEVVLINKDNRKNANKTKEFLNGLNLVVDKLDKCM